MSQLDTLATLGCHENLENSIMDTRYQNDSKNQISVGRRKFSNLVESPTIGHTSQLNQPISDLKSIFNCAVMASKDEYGREVDSLSNSQIYCLKIP